MVSDISIGWSGSSLLFWMIRDQVQIKQLEPQLFWTQSQHHILTTKLVLWMVHRLTDGEAMENMFASTDSQFPSPWDTLQLVGSMVILWWAELQLGVLASPQLMIFGLGGIMIFDPATGFGQFEYAICNLPLKSVIGSRTQYAKHLLGLICLVQVHWRIFHMS